MSVVLRRWGCPASPFAVWVSFSFRFGGSWRSVVCWCRSRRSAARLLWRFRAAVRWYRSLWRPGWGGVMRPPARVVGACVPRFGLRWLACRPVRLRVCSFRPFRGRSFVPRRVVFYVVPAFVVVPLFWGAATGMTLRGCSRLALAGCQLFHYCEGFFSLRYLGASPSRARRLNLPELMKVFNVTIPLTSFVP